MLIFDMFVNLFNGINNMGHIAVKFTDLNLYLNLYLTDSCKKFKKTNAPGWNCFEEFVHS